VDEDNELWELVRKRVYNEEPEDLGNIEEAIGNSDVGEQEEINQTIHEEPPESFLPDLAILFKEGIFAGFIYIFVIMIVLGILTIPGSITAAVGGFFGGRKAGDPARALTAAMLPFLIIAGLYFLASTVLSSAITTATLEGHFPPTLSNDFPWNLTNGEKEMSSLKKY